MKTCKKCNIEKNDDQFYKSSGSQCKECVKSNVRKNYNKIGDAYDRTEHGVIRVMYKTQKRHNKLRCHGLMPYSKDEFSLWLYSNGFKQLYNEWVLSDYSNELKPSVDRINDFYGYSFENIRLGTWRMNRNHQAQDIKNGVGTSGKRCKKVMKYDINNKLLCEYVSYSAAVRDCGYSIEYQIRNGVKCRNGFFWSYSF